MGAALGGDFSRVCWRHHGCYFKVSIYETHRLGLIYVAQLMFHLQMPAEVICRAPSVQKQKHLPSVPDFGGRGGSPLVFHARRRLSAGLGILGDIAVSCVIHLLKPCQRCMMNSAPELYL